MLEVLQIIMIIFFAQRFFVCLGRQVGNYLCSNIISPLTLYGHVTAALACKNLSKEIPASCKFLKVL